MKIILYFSTYDNDTYFYDSIDDLLQDWNCKSLNEFFVSHSNYRFRIFKIDSVVMENLL